MNGALGSPSLTPFIPKREEQSFSQGSPSPLPSRHSTSETKVWLAKFPLFEWKSVHGKHIQSFSFEKFATFCHFYSWLLKIEGFSFELLIGLNQNWSSSINKGTK